MSSLDKALETQLQNIESRTGKTRDELSALVRDCGLAKHGEIREFLIRDLGLGYGDANSLVHYALQSDGTRAAEAKGLSENALLDEIYSGAKAVLRPIHDRLMERIIPLGDFEIVPKKGYVSLRRKKQFAMIGPATNTRIEVGLNGKEMDATERLVEQPAGSMCHFKVKLTEAAQVDDELLAWIEKAYNGAG